MLRIPVMITQDELRNRVYRKQKIRQDLQDLQDEIYA
jgi:hypothetical protein